MQNLAVYKVLLSIFKIPLNCRIADFRNKIWVKTSLNMMLEFIFIVPGQHSVAWIENLNSSFEVLKGNFSLESRKYLKVLFLN